MHILIIDDDPEDCEFFHEAVREIDASFTSEHVHDGRTGITMLKKSVSALPDFIFLDINMPAMNGKECLVELKKHPQLKDIPVVMYSTTSNTQEIKTFYNLGAHDFLIKPHNFTRLVEALQSVILSNGARKKPRR